MPANRGIQSGNSGAGGRGIGAAARRIGGRRDDGRLCRVAGAGARLFSEILPLKPREEDGPERRAGSTTCLDSPPRIWPVIFQFTVSKSRRSDRPINHSRNPTGKSFPEMGNMLHLHNWRRRRNRECGNAGRGGDEVVRTLWRGP